ncbi:MAG: lytic transglycosylase domain-containing protein [candidate division KSB1 bacterium]|nr:lytic transglycosylase domain-containing protein [candidate division KSB1 bacterium]MDZ7391627.1 lytic transglycosylase domain-containing protein [candidate division KSB1 bacterium]MDZ7413976.1 lytic transglycosylase domain-containing protein [candidate division KSB1 bacterium]
MATGENRVKHEGGAARKRLLLIAGIVLTSSCMVGFSGRIVRPVRKVEVTMPAQVAQARALAQVHAKHEMNVQKIAAIVRRYNPKLPPERVRAISREIYDMSLKYDNLDPDLICATITHESARTWDSTVVSPAGAMGLMQIMPATGAYLAELEGIEWTTAEEILFNPIYNIRLGCRYLSMLIEAYEVDGGLAAYNSGPKRAEMWLASNRNNKILYRETRGYIPAVLRLYDQFKNSEGVL